MIFGEKYIVREVTVVSPSGMHKHRKKSKDGTESTVVPEPRCCCRCTSRADPVGEDR